MTASPDFHSDAAAQIASALRGRRTRVALVGAGYIAETHLAALRATPDVEVVAVCDVDAAKAERFVKKHGIANAVASISALAGDVRPDAVHVLVPPNLHLGAAKELLSRGIHVLLEKPMVLNSADGRALVQHARDSGARLGVNHNFTFHPLFVRLLKDVESGKIGHVQHSVFVNNNPLRQLTGGDFGNWMFAAPENIILEQGPHPLSQLVRLLGKVVSCDSTPSGRHNFPGKRVFFDTWQASMQCERATAQFYISFGRDFPESWIHVIGQDGSIRVDLLNGFYSVHAKSRWMEFYDTSLIGKADAKAGKKAAQNAFWGYVLPLLKIQPRRDAFFVGMCGSIGAFHKSLRLGARLPVSAEDGVDVLEACESLTMPVKRLLEISPPPPAREIVQFTNPRKGEVAVLGATGFIGGHVVEKLLAIGKPVRILARKINVLPEHLCDPRVHVVQGALDDPAAIDKVVAGCDAVIHLASSGGESYADFERTIVQGSVRVADACVRHGVRRLLYTSTIAVYYFGGGGIVTEDTPVDPKASKRSHYARAKIESEKQLLQMHRDRKLPVVILRPAVVVGERGRPAHTGVGMWPRDTQCEGWGPGTRPIPFVLPEDVASAIVASLDKTNIDGLSFNLAGDVRLTGREYVEELRKATGRPMQFYPTPLWLIQGLDLFKWGVKVMIRKPENPLPSFRDLKTRAFDASLDCSRAKRLLGWAPVADRAKFVERGIVAAVRQNP
ncbi:MAG: NAD-dependent epimerase/dehydratase family protein [Planctomycetota bacterium]